MGLFDVLKTIAKAASGSSQHNNPGASGIIPYGKQKADGGHDPRGNKGPDRTPAQREGDKKRQGPRS